MSFPQLRVRTGYSFKSNYGHLDDIVSRLKELNANYAAIVDNSTWGHVRFDKAIRKAEITPGFGAEIPIVMNGEDYKPRVDTGEEHSAHVQRIDASSPKWRADAFAVRQPHRGSEIQRRGRRNAIRVRQRMC